MDQEKAEYVYEVYTYTKVVSGVTIYGGMKFVTTEKECGPYGLQPGDAGVTTHHHVPSNSVHGKLACFDAFGKDAADPNMYIGLRFYWDIKGVLHTTY